MSGLDTLPLSTSAYIADTQHLSLPQHGAYLLILMSMWRSKGWLPDDDRVLANICKLSLPKWLKIAGVVRALLITKDGKLSQKRLLLESENAQKRVLKCAQNGSLGGAAKALKNQDPTLATAKNPPDDRQPAKENATTFLSSKDSDSNLQSKKKNSRGEALPSGWQPNASEVQYGIALGLTRADIDDAAEEMRLWARANSNRPIGRKADWSATFKNWMRRIATKRKGRPPASPLQSRNGPAALLVLMKKQEESEREANRPHYVD